MNSKGEKLVRVTFNPSNDGIVDQIKQKAAELINLVDSIDVLFFDDPADVARWKALAITDIESSAMWGVKAATAPKLPGSSPQQQG